jgi:hypothetical protein
MTKTVNNRQAVISKIHDVGSMWMDEMWDTRLEDGGWSSRDQFLTAVEHQVWDGVLSGGYADEMRHPTDSQVEAGTVADITDEDFRAIYLSVTSITNHDFGLRGFSGRNR